MADVKIADAKRLAQKLGAEGVIILQFDYMARGCRYASYGTDRARCQRTQRIADRIMDMIESGGLEV